MDIWLNLPGITSDDQPSTTEKQRNWDTPICKLELDSLIQNAEAPVDKARYLSVSQPHASDWLEAYPIPSLGLKMENKQFRVAVALRLGANICHQHTCVCGKTVDQVGIHGLSCKKSAGIHFRHSQVNDLIKRARLVKVLKVLNFVGDIHNAQCV